MSWFTLASDFSSYNSLILSVKFLLNPFVTQLTCKRRYFEITTNLEPKHQHKLDNSAANNVSLYGNLEETSRPILWTDRSSPKTQTTNSVSEWKRNFADLLNVFNDTLNVKRSENVLVRRTVICRMPSVSFHRRIDWDQAIFMVNLRARN